MIYTNNAPLIIDSRRLHQLKRSSLDEQRIFLGNSLEKTCIQRRSDPVRQIDKRDNSNKRVIGGKVKVIHGKRNGMAKSDCSNYKRT